ncbi:MAG: hypothetical protein XXXJIFNMEKO3_02319 [Candidatus Erwinia impunctatus]|nr:hypothetical protein XXXJIFNMEKO_02319 [Culicoides impunctatus]
MLVTIVNVNIAKMRASSLSNCSVGRQLTGKALQRLSRQQGSLHCSTMEIILSIAEWLLLKLLCNIFRERE